MKKKDIFGMATLGGGMKVNNMRLLGGGEDALFGNLEPDDGKAYVAFEICKALPAVAGPEMHGRYFGYHPQVLANSHQRLLHQQTNIGHRLKKYGTSRNDCINGCVIAVAFPKTPYAGWQLGEAEAAPSMTVLAVMFKAANGVNRLLGDHQANRKKCSVSIESSYQNTELGIFDPEDMSVTPIMEAIEQPMGEAITFDEEKGLQIGKFEGRQLAFAPGCVDGEVDFEGVGYTPTPAESTAKITRIAASAMAERTGFEEYDVSLGKDPKYYIGQAVRWDPIFAWGKGRGEVVAVHYEGTHAMHGDSKEATEENPLLEIQLPGVGSKKILRYADGVKG